MWVCGVKSSEGVAFSDQSFGRVSQVGDHVRDVATGDVFFGGLGYDAPELLFTGTTGGRQLHVGETLLRFPGVGVPVCLSEIGESVVRGFCEDHGERSSQMNEDGKVVRVKSGRS